MFDGIWWTVVNALQQGVFGEGVSSTCAVFGDGRSPDGNYVLGAFCICFLCFVFGNLLYLLNQTGHCFLAQNV
jgi:hypothetical protein